MNSLVIPAIAFFIAFASASAENPLHPSATQSATESVDPLDRITLPRIDFRDATVAEIAKFLTEKCKQDNTAGKGFEFVVRDETLRQTRVTFAVKSAPLSAVIRYCVLLADCTIQRERAAYIFAPADPQSPPVPANQKRVGSALLKAIGIQFPRLDLAGSTFREAIDFIQARSVGLDEKGEGVNVILKPGPEMDKIRITLKLDNFPLAEVIRLVARQAGYTVDDDDFALIIRPKTN